MGFGELAGVMLRNYPRRTVLGLALIVSQAFLYNGVFFTFPLVLRKFYGVPPDRIGYYILPFASAISWGRSCWAGSSTRSAAEPMIGGTYTISAVLLALSGYLFASGRA